MNLNDVFEQYLKNLAETAQRGDAREESFYPALSSLLSKVAQAMNLANMHVTTLPRSTDAGNPDFRIWNGKDRIIGYVEAKKPTEQYLDRIAESDQLRRYRTTFPNLILTNFLEFRLYRNGEQVDAALLGRPVVLNRLRMAPPAEQVDALARLLDSFLRFDLPRTFSAESLAVELAVRTRFLRDIVARQLAEERNAPGPLSGFFEAFQKFLISDLTSDNFADLYAQTITYGLFAARVRSNEPFNRRVAFDCIPRTIGVLRDLFRFISLGDLPTELEWIVDDIAQVLAVADAPGILSAYFRQGKGNDPIVHFYETFLAHYDPQERERRGVYYTPEPVVAYIVRSLHSLLKTAFGKADGLASQDVTLLDPAAGTMTFIARAAQEAVREFERTYGSGALETFIRDHILQDFYAFELMMAPYAVGHLKMSFFLEELGHRPADEERVRFYLTNTLDMAELEQSRLPGFAALAEESRLAGEVKRQTPILVILGNPPYSGHSVNRGVWIVKQIEAYKQVDGKPLGEKNPKWLQDDYVKFLRFAQWKIEQAGCGVVGIITNHGYLDNPTFRGMRQSLLHTFDNIYVLNLHGNALKRERAPDGSPDENVFDIRQGVAIAFFVKTRKKRQLKRFRRPRARKVAIVFLVKTGKKKARVRYADLWGDRVKKYAWLDAHSIANTTWRDLRPTAPLYLFAPQDETLAATYNAFVAVPDLFPLNSVGIVTARDRLTIHWSPEEVWETVRVFAYMAPDLARQSFALGPDVQDWKVTLAQEDLRSSGPDRARVAPILYRPFDVRYTYYTGQSRGFICRPREEVMQHMLAGENVALLTPRRVEHAGTWQHAFVCTAISEHVAVSLKTIDYHFPLYCYPDAQRRDLFAHLETTARQPNLNKEIVAALTAAHSRQPTPETIFSYVYAILYAPAYRERYANLLRLEFPRIPLTTDRDLFDRLATLGKRLVDLHLLRSTALNPPLARFEGTGDSRVAKGKSLHYDAATQRVYVNKTQYFAPVPPEVWNYQIGGYQVCHKWLKDRVERQLSSDEVRTYCRIVTALAHTLEIQAEIDALYDDIEATKL